MHAAFATPPPCSLNGQLRLDGTCDCDVQWEGPECERLRLLPADPSAGLQPKGELGVFSTWGGSVMRDDGIDGTYHMFAAVFEHGCGLNAWRPNSAIARAESSAAAGPYTLKEVIKPHFAHSPQVVRGANGEWLVYHVGAGTNDTSPCADPSAPTCGFTRNCSGGCTGPSHPWLSGLTMYGPAAVLRADSPRGPWSSHVIGACADVPGCEANASYKGNGNDMNPAPMTGSDGSVRMLWRSIDYTSTGKSYYAAASAPAWDGAYAWNTTNLFPDFAWCHIEDGFMWRNRRGWHAVFHSDCEKTSGGAAGGHAYSSDGVQWHFHPKNAFHQNVTMRDGTVWRLKHRERPKLIIDADGQITHLISGAGRGPPTAVCSDRGSAQVGDPSGSDHTFTFIQPIATS
jgi:hypothetical protein